MDKKQSVHLAFDLGEHVEFPRGSILVAQALGRLNALNFDCSSGFQGFPQSRKRNHW
ncbi:hypothetical protein [Salipiger sp.]|uniref:hypothetical protein n=1 Tax=Salipiger sp. TaxID=2078585 RepID=UPI003A98470B